MKELEPKSVFPESLVPVLEPLPAPAPAPALSKPLCVKASPAVKGGGGGGDAVNLPAANAAADSSNSIISARPKVAPKVPQKAGAESASDPRINSSGCADTHALYPTKKKQKTE